MKIKIISRYLFNPLSLIILTVSFLILYFYLETTGLLVSYENYLFQKKLNKVLRSGVQEIHLKELTDFEWDKVCLHPPYGYDGSLDGAILDDIYSNLQFYKNNNEIKVFPLVIFILPNLVDGYFYNIDSFCFTPDSKIFVKNNKILTIKN